MLNLFKENKMFRFLLGYQVFSGLGGGVFSIFMLLSVHLIYQTPMYTGIAAFLMAAPQIAAFAVGPMIDRKNKPRIMRITTLLEFLVLATLVVVPFQELFGVWFMFAALFIYSVAALFEQPAGTAFLPKIVEDDKIVVANSAIDIAALSGGVIIAVSLFAALGNDIDFRYIYAVSAAFLGLAFIFGLFLKESNAEKEQKKPDFKKYIGDLKEGAKFIRESILIYITIVVLVMVFAIEIASVNIPAFAEYHVGAQGYIVIAMMSLIGGILASGFIGTVGKKFSVGKLVVILLIIQGVLRVIYVMVLPLHMIGGFAILVFYGMMGSSIGILFQSLRQKLPPKDMVGRVATINTTLVAILVALGSLAGGFLGTIVPVVDHILIYQGAAYILFGIIVLCMPAIRKLPPINNIERHGGEEDEQQ